MGYLYVSSTFCINQKESKRLLDGELVWFGVGYFDKFWTSKGTTHPQLLEPGTITLLFNPKFHKPDSTPKCSKPKHCLYRHLAQDAQYISNRSTIVRLRIINHSNGQNVVCLKKRSMMTFGGLLTHNWSISMQTLHDISSIHSFGICFWRRTRKVQLW